MTYVRKSDLCFGADRVVALQAPVRTTKMHRSHLLDAFVVELNEGTDTATIHLSEVDTSSGSILTTRESMSIPLGMLADLVRRRPMTTSEKEDFAQMEEEAFEDEDEVED